MDDNNNEEQMQKVIELVLKAKPYLRALENRFSDVEYGEVTATFTIHRNQVEKMAIIVKENTWSRQKDSPPPPLDLKSKE